MRITLKAIVSTVIVTPSRSGRQRLGLHDRLGVDEHEQRRRREVPHRGQDDRQAKRRQERLVDDAVDLVRLVGAGKARHEHGHAGEERADEDDDDDDDLPPMAALAV
jgi:hypothetical protein